MKNFLKWILFSLWIIFTFLVFWLTYWVWSNLSTRETWDVITKDIWNELVQSVNNLWTKVDWLSNIPTWAIMAFNLNSCPEWWLEANWTNSTPDLRWEFIRWLDNGRWLDSWRVLASKQNATRVFHYSTDDEGWQWRQVDMASLVWADYDWSIQLVYTRLSYASLATGSQPINNSKVYWIRVRPTNVAFLYCIKN